MKPMAVFRRDYLHEFFEAGVFLKALNAAWETLSGLFLLLAGHSALERILVFVSGSQLLGDHDDLVFLFVTGQLHQLSVSTHLFVGIYLLFHGIMNGFLAYNLYRDRLWAFPVSIAFISTFFIYQMYRLEHTHSPILLAVSIFDLFFIILTWREYQLQKRNAHQRS
jgi:uncharacterized membrane protein